MKEEINWYGTYCVTLREIKRFMRVYNQTILTPMISALIFLAIFVLASGSMQAIDNVKFINFIGYGLIAMSFIQNSFENSSSSFIMSKMFGYIIDVLIPPLGSVEIILAFTLGAVVRGVIVGTTVAIALTPFLDYEFHHPLLMVFYILASCTMMAKLGILTGIMSRTFDQRAAIVSYIVTPLTFLSGTFYSIDKLPWFFREFNFFNPIFYIIDGFRYCFTNSSHGNIYIGMSVIIALNVILYYVLKLVLDAGWKIKS